jgi:nitrogen-specific signal transduction histidine kinase/CheY-like chemotaxis protein
MIQFDRKDYLLGVGVDTTERRALEEQLRQARKMESIGTLSGGIAHDFNNILSIIIGNTELALDDVPEWNVAHGNLVEIKNAGLRAKNIVSQLLAFSRKTDLNLKPVAIVPVIKDALAFLRSTIPSTIDICADIVDSGETVLADPVQLNQIMMNLCINASHAMEETGGVLSVNVAAISLDKTSAEIDSDLVPGEYVKLTVSDTGPGIDPDIADRIFDPYFTTKGVGKGSGMGLAVVHGIVKNHNGAIFLDSEYGKGAVFSILLPKITEKPEVKVETTTDLSTGNETILFVDDDESLMKLGQRMLESLGYQIDAFISPTDALEQFLATPDKYDLIITDMTMPKMTGVALAEKLMRIRPDIQIIICTGHSALIDEEKAKTMDIAAFVMKPFSRQKIARIIRQVLDGSNEK